MLMLINIAFTRPMHQCEGTYERLKQLLCLECTFNALIALLSAHGCICPCLSLPSFGRCWSIDAINANYDCVFTHFFGLSKNRVSSPSSLYSICLLFTSNTNQFLDASMGKKAYFLPRRTWPRGKEGRDKGKAR